MSLPFTPEDAQYYFQEANELREAYTRLREAIREVLEVLRDVRHDVAACMFDAECDVDFEYFRMVLRKVRKAEKMLENVLEETG